MVLPGVQERAQLPVPRRRVGPDGGEGAAEQRAERVHAVAEGRGAPLGECGGEAWDAAAPHDEGILPQKADHLRLQQIKWQRVAKEPFP